MTIWLNEISDQVQEDARAARSPAEVIPSLEEYFQGQSVRVLEIGVFRAGLTSRIAESRLNIEAYDGVDPYLGGSDDPYVSSTYWRNPDEANSVFLEAQQVFDQHQYRLHRMSSVDFHQQLGQDDVFDVIYVDGDHRYQPALWDCCAFLPHVADGGVLIIDDYANVDNPDVTRAANAFVRHCRANIACIGYVDSWFRNTGKFIPIVQVAVMVAPVPRRDRIEYELPPANISTINENGQHTGAKLSLSRQIRDLTRRLRSLLMPGDRGR